VADYGRYEAEPDGELTKGQLTPAGLDEEEQSLDRMRRWYRAIGARDLFGVPGALLAERRGEECTKAPARLAGQLCRAREHGGGPR
jgi:hypothetical protein